MPSVPSFPGLSRRRFLQLAALLVGGVPIRGAGYDRPTNGQVPSHDRQVPITHKGNGTLTLFLSGDVMPGRGIDQILPVSAPSRLYEPSLTDARQYIRLAEAVNGPIPRPVDPAYVWGDALAELAAFGPAARIVNLETAVTARGAPWKGKAIHYRLHPDNVGLLQIPAVDCCVLANNHVLDWGYPGLRDTLSTLGGADILVAGAGEDNSSAQAPAVIPVGKGSRVLVFGLASPTSGVPPAWRANSDRPGVNLIGDDIGRAVRSVSDLVGQKRPRDIVVVSIHWGANWGYEIPAQQRVLAHALIDSGCVDIVHGHSSHHPKGIEVYRDRLILYGCGDLLNDYEGIRGQEQYRGDLSLMYFPALDITSGRLLGLTLSPMRIRRFRLERAATREGRWMRDSLNRLGEVFGTRFRTDQQGRLELESGGHAG